MTRNLEFGLGLAGSIWGILNVLFLSYATWSFSMVGVPLVSATWKFVIFGFIFSIIGIVGSVLTKSGRVRLGGSVMLVSAIGGLVSVFLAYLIPFILLLIAGLLSLLRKEK